MRQEIRLPTSMACLAASALIGLSGCQTPVAPTGAPCADRTVHIYFETNSVEVTDEGRAVIAQAARIPDHCRVDSVEILGLADASGAAQANLELSKRRAQSVTAAIAASNLPAADFEMSAAGEAGATTEEGVTQPVRRRVDVVLRLLPR